MEPRPITLMRFVAEMFPNVYKEIEKIRETNGKPGMMSWPKWCYCPLLAAQSFISYTHGYKMTDVHMQFTGIIGAMSAWRMSQGIYRFDSDIFESVWNTPVNGEIPIELLFQLPEWCVYIETPGKTIWLDTERPLFGFYAFLEYDAQTNVSGIFFCLDCDERVEIPYNIPLYFDEGERTLEGIIKVFKNKILNIPTHKRNLYEKNILEGLKEQTNDLDKLAPQLPPLLSLVLYICTQNNELTHPRDESKKPRKPTLKKVGSEMKLFPPTTPTTWNVGLRMGAQLRAAEQKLNEQPQGSHASPRPHSRRAHWHPYWYGKRGTDQRILKLKWLNQMLINAKPEQLVPFVREVDRGDEG